jgi:phosphomannomutase
MSKKGKTLHELLEPLREKYFISGEINTSVSGHDVVQSRLGALKAKYGDGNTYEVDGFSVEYPDWHFNVRASNTEPLLRLNLEAKTPEMMEKKRHEVLSVIRGT